MKKAVYSLVFAMVLVFLAPPSFASTVTVTFDDVPGAAIGLPIPNGYRELTWYNMSIVDNSDWQPSGYKNGIVSGNWVAYNACAGDANVSLDGNTFDFVGGYFTAAWRNGLTIDVTGYLAGEKKYFQSITVDASGPTLFVFDYLDVDLVWFSSYGGTYAGFDYDQPHFAVDNMIFQSDSFTMPVPLPGALWLMGSGFAALMALRKRRG